MKFVLKICALIVLVAASSATTITTNTVHAEGSGQTMRICHSSDSTANGQWFEVSDAELISVQRLYPGQCSWEWPSAKVYVYFHGGSMGGYVKSYKIKPAGGSYGPCHNIPSGAKVSNPPDGSNGQKTYYKTYGFTGC